MVKKNETIVWSLALLVTLVILGGAIFWVDRLFNLRLPFSESSTTSPTGEPGTFAEFAAKREIPAGNWLYSGSTAWASIRGKLDEKIKTDVPQFQLIYTQDPGAPSSARGIEMLLAGRISFAHSSRPILGTEYEQATRRGFQIKQIPVAYDAIAVVVHPDLNITGLTLQQLIDIYTGKIDNWQALGGSNLAIQPYTAPLNSGAPSILKEFFPKGEEFASRVMPTNTPTEAIQKVGSPQNANDRGGIYLASARNLIGQCQVKPLAIGRSSNQFIAPYMGELIPPEQCPAQRNQLDEEAIRTGKYPLVRRLFVIVKADDSIDTKVGNTYADLVLTQEGQSLIEAAGYIPLRSF